MDFGVYATPACDHARRKERPPAPDADGMFDAAGVDVICGRRQCYAEQVSELFIDIQFKETKVRVTAIAPGRWDPVSILAACTKAHGNRVYEVDYTTAKPENRDGVDELRIAAVVGADGIRPYLSRKSRYSVGPGDAWQTPPAPTGHGARGGAIDAADLLVPDEFFAPVGAGHPTWALRSVLSRWRRSSDYSVCRALRALEDVGLVHIELGKRGGMATAKVTWTPRAFLAPERLAPADEEALEMLA